ncbi:uncharacterized protein EI97DRAFT_442931 [Westerdykella ornata]|uniref:Mid2 domain-containing protein n=1 Tax=Westerdykella ornata TaxID=318751 RepID=A0A6A6JHC5_WESOR|nr:uncharacterized protein EI97DRAFT_442931 [Westerdykella ornata]KAF2275961.1 hypothetical protein EI97DRAFT_442931 [Westerdykella ornata]
MSVLTYSIILYALFHGAVSNPFKPAITPPPVLRRQGEDDLFPESRGWFWVTYGSRTELSSIYFCDISGIFITTSSYVGCCYSRSTGPCFASNVATGCSNGTLALFPSTTLNCEDIFSTAKCNTDYVYTGSTPDASPLQWIGCNRVADQALYFQEPPRTGLTSPTSFSTTSTRSASQSSPAGPLSSPPSQTGAGNPTSSAGLSTEDVQEDSDKAWIAGVVIGAVALLAMAGMAFWLLRIRKRNKQQSYSQAPQTAEIYPEQPIPGSYTSPQLNTASLSPYQDAAGPSPSLSDQRASQGWSEDSRAKSWHQHNASPGAPSAAPLFTGTEATELPELVNPPSRR